MAWVMTALAIRRNGGRPLRITPAHPADETRLRGVVIGGGTDVDPFHYGEERPGLESLLQEDDGEDSSSLLDWLVGLLLTLFRSVFARHSAQGYDPDRDALEQHHIRHALYHRLPILGICRGAQLMNVTLGGSLHQNIEHFYTEGTSNVRSILPRKPVAITPDTHLQRILDTHTCRVNALHEQSIKDLGDEILVSAAEPTGVIQAIERRSHPFFIGVQWHPEYIPQSRSQQGLFRSLVKHSHETGPAGD
jgi:putative glutamine amidotransferase